MRLFILSILFTAVSLNGYGKKFSGQEVKEDLEFLVQSIREYNAALDVYNPNFGEEVKAVISTVQGDSIAPLRYYGLVSRICALSNEGHMNIGGWDDDFRKGIPDGSYKYMPFSVDIVSGEVYVRRDFTPDNHFQRGDEILAINNTPAAEVLKELRSYIPTDGTITTHADMILGFVFPFYYYFFIAQPESFTVQYKTTAGDTKSVTIEASNKNAQEDIYNTRYAELAKAKKEESIADYYEVKYDEQYTLLQLKSFNYKLTEQYKVEAKELYEDIFTTIQEKKINTLIIDLRGNMGGRNEFADDMVPFIMKEPGNDTYLKKTISWKGKERTYKLPKKHKQAFAGKVYVLVNGRTFSSASMLARYLKEYANATVIGEETATRYEGFAAGSNESVHLPHSNLRIDIPRYHILFPVSQKQKTRKRTRTVFRATSH